mmetsp:Transcript_3995/g.9634  ORF Transcript_3995/g.9634 Transcript_3995/m.9634 type:complete len:152 (+) Transcript_3995:107-562(+)|eukprot:3595296-Rhodomonas_salina.3
MAAMRTPALIAAAVLVLSLASVRAGDDDPECTAESFRGKFGAEPLYQLLSTPAPRIKEGMLLATVRYESPCKSGGSAFTVTHTDKHGVDVFVASRGEPECSSKLESPAVFQGEITAAIPAGFEFKGLALIAFPPDGEYESMNLEYEAPTVA